MKNNRQRRSLPVRQAGAEAEKLKKYHVFEFCILIFALIITPVFAGSLWNENSASPYSTQKVYKIGDIINVLIVESSSAKNLADTKTTSKDDLSAKFTHTIQRLAPIIGTGNQMTGQLSNVYEGKGQTVRGSSVQARIAAWVTEIFPNGNLEIRGKHIIEVNDEVQEITITGIVRPKDITGTNSVYSYNVANANLSIKGTGTVADAEMPGWITRFLNWLF